MVAAPRDAPSISPVAEPIDAIPGALLLHVPPADRSLKGVVNPIHTFGLPRMVPGSGLTVTVTAVPQPEGGKYEITDNPAAIPVTTPLADPTLATPVDPELQVPAAIASVSMVVVPGQRGTAPVIDGGIGFTVVTAVFTQPAALV